MGGSGSGAGGGSTSGKTDWPKHLKKQQHCVMWGTTDYTDFPGNTQMSDRSAMDALIEAWDNNPYLILSAFDPSSLFDMNQNRLDLYASIVDDIDPSTQWASFLSTAKTEFDDTLVDTAHTELAVERHRDALRPGFNRTLSQFNGGMQDIGSVMSSQFVIGSALLRLEHEAQVNQFSSQIQLAKFQDRVNFVSQQISSLSTFFFNHVESLKGATVLQTELNKMKNAGMKEFYDEEQELEIGAAGWHLDIFQPVSNLLSSMSGGAVSKTKTAMEKDKGGTKGALGGALSGAAGGALLAVATGGMSLAAGAALGAAGGGLMGSQ